MTDRENQTFEQLFLFTIDWKNRTSTNELISSMATLNLVLHIYINDNDQEDYLVPDGARLRIKPHRMGKNIGFAAACNEAFKMAQQTGYLYIMHLNNDIQLLHAGELPKFIALFTTLSNCIAASPAVIKKDGSTEFAGSSVFAPTSTALIISRKKIETPSPENYRWSLFFDGAAFIARIEPCLQLGVFVSDYFAYREEHDFGFRARRAGYKIAYISLLRVVHDTSATARKYSRLKNFLLTRNQILFLRRNLKGRERIGFALILAAKICLKSLVALIRGDKQTLGAIIDALNNQLKGREILFHHAEEQLIFHGDHRVETRLNG